MDSIDRVVGEILLLQLEVCFLYCKVGFDHVYCRQAICHDNAYQA